MPDHYLYVSKSFLSYIKYNWGFMAAISAYCDSVIVFVKIQMKYVSVVNSILPYISRSVNHYLYNFYNDFHFIIQFYH